tara:strand:- start:40847 stop:41023 length:177 start_codon:yes stop_codon:yes gene_type:complete
LISKNLLFSSSKSEIFNAGSDSYNTSKWLSIIADWYDIEQQRKRLEFSPKPFLFNKLS